MAGPGRGRQGFTPLACLIALATAAGDGRAYARQTEKQTYSAWKYHQKYRYYWRYYHYKPKGHHYAIYHTSRGKRIYDYNPQKKRYWGYYDVEGRGYSLLPDRWRKESLNDIPAEAFPKPDPKMPLIPGEIISFEPPNDELPRVE